jgi:hypothetical protein
MYNSLQKMANIINLTSSFNSINAVIQHKVFEGTCDHCDLPNCNDYIHYDISLKLSFQFKAPQNAVKIEADIPLFPILVGVDEADDTDFILKVDNLASSGSYESRSVTYQTISYDVVNRTRTTTARMNFEVGVIEVYLVRCNIPNLRHLINNAIKNWRETCNIFRD